MYFNETHMSILFLIVNVYIYIEREKKHEIIWQACVSAFINSWGSTNLRMVNLDSIRFLLISLFKFEGCARILQENVLCLSQNVFLHLDSCVAQGTDRYRYILSPPSLQELTEGNWMLLRTVFGKHRSKHIRSDLGRKIFFVGDDRKSAEV